MGGLDEVRISMAAVASNPGGRPAILGRRRAGNGPKRTKKREIRLRVHCSVPFSVANESSEMMFELVM